MGIKTPEEYRSSLKDGRRVFFRGQQVDDVTAHPVLRKAIDHAAIDYNMANDPQWRDLATVDTPQGTISRYYHIPQSVNDLLARSRLIEESTRLGGTVVCLIHEIGTDALFGLMHIASQMDRENGSDYGARVKAFFDRAAAEDLALAVAQTDAKGDRRLQPSEQAHPDYYLRIVERRKDGIVVRGAKMHTSVSINANELIVLPTRGMKADDRDYAVSFAVPLNTPGLTLVASPYDSEPKHPFEFPLSATHKMLETMTIFEDVFVPWERVFMAGEWQWAGPLAQAFVQFHRFTAVSYKLPLVDLLVGAGAQVAQYNGIAAAGHVKDKLSRLIAYASSVRTLCRAAAQSGAMQEPGIFAPHEATVNLAKYQFAHDYHVALRDVQDLAGGLLVTGPGHEDLEHPEIGPLIQRYLGTGTFQAEDRLRLINLISDLTTGALGGYHAVLAVHAEGSLEAEKLMITRGYDVSGVQQMARELAGIGGGTK
jgi:4-hydroxybutyryl-CoA dehydratase/vinylacetyl-CoA-Delta-isomerase